MSAESEIPFEFKYGIIAIRQAEGGMADILHFCGYEEPPTQADYDALGKELATDKEFGLVASMDQIKLVEAPQEIVDLYRDMMQTDPNWHESN